MFQYNFQIKKFNMSIDYRYHSRFVIGCLLLFILTFFVAIMTTQSIMLYYELPSGPKDIFLNVCGFALSVALAFHVFFFSMVAMAVRSRFKLINGIITLDNHKSSFVFFKSFFRSKFFKTEIDEDINGEDIDDDRKQLMLSSLASLHDQLCATVSIINICFALTVAFVVGLILMSIILSCFELYALLAASTHSVEIIVYCAIANLWNFFIFSFIFTMVTVCSLSKKEAKMTAIHLHKALHYQETETVQKRVRFL